MLLLPFKPCLNRKVNRMRNKLYVAATIILFTLFVTMFGFGASDDNPHGEISQDCQDCHTPTSWKHLASPMKFDHDKTGFRLDGSHSKAECMGCHKELVFKNVGTACIDCHADHHLGQFGTNCQSCHTAQDWQARKDIIDLHIDRGFPLTGVHAVADCESCHKNSDKNEFVGTSTACQSCHSETMAATTNPNHMQAGFTNDCENCHRAGLGTWNETFFEHTSKFPLVGQHKNADCIQCHVNNTFAGNPSDCYSCHSANYVATTAPDHQAAGFSFECAGCHTPNGWIPAAISGFDHNLTAFPLTGAHLSATCISCHASGFAGTSTDCYSCHQPDYDGTIDPQHALAGFSTNCASCHTTVNWPSGTFDHTQTAFALTGAHLAATCISCHATQFAGTPANCYACHQTNYDATTSPDHLLAGFSTDCSSCHTTASWPTGFDHSQTAFPLTGAHIVTACISCHATQFAGTPTTCVSCHQANYDATTAPVHSTAGFGTDCVNCHVTNGWPNNFNHQLTAFPLTGAHSMAACISCHATQYAGTPTNCYACHQPEYDGTTSPVHSIAGFSTDCVTCHNTTSWPTGFDHNLTAFPLTGAHTLAACMACHATQFAGTPTNCYACHQLDYEATTNPDHQAANMNTACASCHTTKAWLPGTFNHAQTTFPLTGAHLGVLCNSCHVTQFAGTPKTCISCHQTTYDGTANPNHLAAGFGTDCGTCHTTSNWPSGNFNHSLPPANFPLTGAHATTMCISCHVNNTFAGTPINCVDCHQSNFDAHNLINPAHAAFGTACANCHTTAGWPTNFNHSLTAFPLTGAHITAACVACHSAGYAGTPTNCYACHQAKYDGTTNPNHMIAGFSTDCKPCHGTIAWPDGTFNHSQTGFPLVGAHLTATCLACHATQFAGTPNTCYACHRTDYDNTTNPDHSLTGFGTNCVTCHTPTTFTTSTWNHDAQYFRIYSGKHKGKWNKCNDCHVIPNNYAVVECTEACHQHPLTEMNNKHRNVRNYSSQGNACAACHPRV